MDINNETRDEIEKHAQAIIKAAEDIANIINLPDPTPDDPDSVAICEWANNIRANAEFIASKLKRAVPRHGL